SNNGFPKRPCTRSGAAGAAQFSGDDAAFGRRHGRGGEGIPRGDADPAHASADTDESRERAGFTRDGTGGVRGEVSLRAEYPAETGLRGGAAELRAAAD